MTATLRLDAIGSGKSAMTIDLLRAALRADAMPRVWTLMATARQTRFCRRRLAQEAETAACFNIDFFNFYQLNKRLLNLARQPARDIGRHTQIALLRQLTAQMAAEGLLRHFPAIAHTRGFIEVIADFINELKQNGIRHEDLADAASSDKERDIAAIYGRYQAELRDRNLVDREGEGWLALARLRDKPEIASAVTLLLVDGFDQFTAVQAQTLAQLARVIPQVDITLTLPQGKAGEFTRRGALARERLQSEFANASVDLNETWISSRDDSRHPHLAALGRAIFQNESAGESGDALRLVVMPSDLDEVKAILRQVKRRLLDGARPDEILIALRDWGRYAPHFRRIGDEYGLPLQLHNPPPLISNPLIVALIDLVELAPQFRRRDLLDILRSPYLHSELDEADINWLDQISREQVFPRGSADDWIALLQRAEAEAQSKKLAAFFSRVTPPQSAPLERHIDWLDDLLADGETDDESALLRIPADAPDDDSLAGRDNAAVKSLRRLLQERKTAEALLRMPHERPPDIAWEDFWSELKGALDTAYESDDEPSRAGKALITTASNARGLPHDHLFIPGLAEGAFPGTGSEDPLLLDSERDDLKRRGINLATQDERADDRGVFIELISLPRKSLTLTRPAAQAGKPWLESYLWRAALTAFPSQEVETSAAGQVVAPEAAASISELMLSAADRALLDPWLARDSRFSEGWQHIQRGKSIETKRLSRLPVDAYSGQITHPDLRRYISQRLDRDRVYSATQLKDYGLCGFRFFAKRLLRLEESPEPEAGYDVLQLGSLNHKILEDTYMRYKDLNLPINEENQAAALDIFEEIADKALDRAPNEFGFHAPSTWVAERQMLQKRLRAVVRLDFSDASPLNAFFGTRRVRAVEQDFDRISIDLPEPGERLLLRGLIDRVDEVDGKLIVVDYKTGTTKINRVEMENGRDFQMMTYVLALRQLLHKDGDAAQVRAGMFWHLRDLAASGKYDSDDDDDQAAIETALQHVSRYLKSARAGSFPAQPSGGDPGRCASYCEFRRLCRVSVTNQQKGTGGG